MSIHNRIAKLERSAIHNAAPKTAREMSDAQLLRIVQRSPLATGRRIDRMADDEIDALLAEIAGVEA